MKMSGPPKPNKDLIVEQQEWKKDRRGEFKNKTSLGDILFDCTNTA